MISFHFNGEIVRHPDMKQVHKYNIARRDQSGQCQNGVVFLNCAAWTEYLKERPEIQKLSSYGTCTLAGCKKCPSYCKRIEASNKKKSFTIDWKTYRKVASAAHYMIKEGTYKTIFVTLTFPRWKKEHKLTKSFYYDEITNKLFSKFAENLRKNYHCEHYIAVKEYGEKNNRVHFHLIANLPYIPFSDLNNSWVHTISGVCFPSLCALQTDKKTSCVIKNPIRAVRYVCKYVSKSFGRRSDTRVVFISNNTLIRPVKVSEIGFNHIDILKQFKSIHIKTYDYVTVLKVTDRKEFNKFCHNFLYPLFECSIKKTEFCYESTDFAPN